MRLTTGFLLFHVLAVLMVVNGLRAFLTARKSKRRKVKDKSSPIATGVVSLLAAAGLEVGAFYLFWF